MKEGVALSTKTSFYELFSRLVGKKQVFGARSFCPVGYDMPMIVLKSKYLLFVLFRCVNLKFVVNINGVTRVSLFASE